MQGDSLWQNQVAERYSGLEGRLRTVVGHVFPVVVSTRDLKTVGLGQKTGFRPGCWLRSKHSSEQLRACGLNEENREWKQPSWWQEGQGASNEERARQRAEPSTTMGESHRCNPKAGSSSGVPMSLCPHVPLQSSSLRSKSHAGHEGN